jgi:hypothetical protein
MPKIATGTYQERLAMPSVDRDPDSQGGSSLVPMLVVGLIMIVIGMLVVAAIA